MDLFPGPAGSLAITTAVITAGFGIAAIINALRIRRSVERATELLPNDFAKNETEDADEGPTLVADLTDLPGDVQVHLVSVIETDPSVHHRIVISGRARAVLLSIEEYELLRRAAALARNPDRVEASMRRVHAGTATFEQVFGIGST